MRLGDLDALKEVLKSNCTPEICHDYNTAWCESCCKVNDFEDLIDNAPTVDIRNKGACEDCEYFDRPITSEPCRNCTLAYGSCFKEKEKVKDDRPRGEWIIVKDEKYGDNVKCPFCGKELAGTDLNFCCKCGAELTGSAKMNGGKEE